jgi:hypothetical protein
MADDFEKRFLYNEQGEAAVAETEPEYEALTAAGWKHSPAEFGIETHPSIVTQPLQAAPATGATPPSDDMREVVRLLVSYQTQLDALESRVTAVEAQAAATASAYRQTAPPPPAPPAAPVSPPPVESAPESESEPPHRGRRS